MPTARAFYLIYDDTRVVPPEVAAMTGAQRFGDMLRGRARLRASVSALAADAGMTDVLHARTVDDLAAAAESERQKGARALYLVLPSNLAPTAPSSDAVAFLKKLTYFDEPVALWQDDRLSQALVVDRDGLSAYVAAAQRSASERDRLVRDHARELTPVDDALRLADLEDLGVAFEFLSGSFSARHFNHVSQDRFHVTKFSRDSEKIRREYSFFSLLPESLQPYFLQPFNFTESPEGASYRMRRLFVPDLAVQWVNRAMNEVQFQQLLDQIFHYTDERPHRRVDRETGRREAARLYLDKPRDRIDDLLATSAGRSVDTLLRTPGPGGGLEDLLRHYEDLYRRLAGKRRHDFLRLTHGDLGFSNVLYSPSSQTFHLIDPRGASTEDELFSDPLYDFAKLSHSVLGQYDFIVAGLFEVLHVDDLTPSLSIDPGAPLTLQDMFVSMLEAHEVDVRLVRLCEASLFLSMLPLHIDSPKRVLAFALRARDILDEIEGMT
jgi:hypothetical protein